MVRYWTLMLICGSVFALISPDQAQIVDRIKPLGVVHVEGQATQAAVVEAKPLARTGEALYQQYCTVCHESGVAGAPRFRNAGDWQPRLKQAGNVDGLVAVSLKGLNAMPAGGTCPDCTPDEMKAAIEYMLPK